MTKAKKKVVVPAPSGRKGTLQKTIHQLIQLQELLVAKDQQQAGAGGHLEKLDASIDAMLQDLPETLSARFRRLLKKNLLVIVPVANNGCTACGMGLPISLVQQVRIADQLHACPSCARLLYYPEVTLRAQAKRVPRGAPPKVGIARFSGPELMIPRLEATTRDGVIAELCNRLQDEGYVEDASFIVEEALRREAMASTSLDHGLAFPHVRGVEGGGLMMVFGISKKGVKFDDSRSLSRIIPFVLIPTAASSFYLKLLAGMTQTFQDKEAREKILEEEDPAKLWKLLVKLTRSTVK